MAMMDTFQCTDGKPISESELYDWQNPWKNRDPRLDLYCVRSGSRTMGIQFSTDPADKTVYDYISGTSVTNSDVTGNKSEYGPERHSGSGADSSGGNSATRPTTAASRGTGYEDELDVPIIRLAELLLIERGGQHRVGRRRPRTRQIPDRPGPRPGEDAAGGGFVPGGAPQRAPL